MSQAAALAPDEASAVAASSPNTHPPIVRSLNTIYADSKAASQRYSSLVDSFATFFGAAPDFIARAPGRVNLIGEHIDYSGFSVLPMAIARDTLIATRICRPEGTAAQAKAPVAPGSKRIAERQAEEISVMNNDPDAFPDATFSCLESKDGTGAVPKSKALLDHPSVLDIKSPGSSAATAASGEDAEEDPTSATGWTKYVQCGIKGVWEAEQQRRAKPGVTSSSSSEAAAPGEAAGAAQMEPPRRLPGMQMLVDGSVPPAAGLSSSSSLVCCSALATAYALELSAAATPPAESDHLSSFSKLDLATLSANCERYIGTAGGGMDQSISFLATAGFASHISFEPRLSCLPVKLPPGALFLVAHSGRQSEKAKTAATQFNKRVLECTLAAHVLAKQLGVCMYAPPTHDASATASATASTIPAASTQQPQAGEIPKLTLHDVLQASGKSLKEMIEFLQPAAASSSSPAPLHAAPYTVAELHAFFSTNTLKPLLAFRPTLFDALGDDVHSPSVRSRKLGSSSAASKPKVRVTFGRSVQSYSDRNVASEPARSLTYYTAPVASTSTAQAARDKPFPWEIAAEMDRKKALAASIAATNPSSIVPAMDSAAASVADSNAAATPYRNQGDADLYSADQLAARSSLQRDPLLIQSINRFWVLLPKDLSTGELRKEDYMLFFLRLCKLVNPDLSFEESWALIAEDWNRDVARTRQRNKEEAAALLAESKSKGKSRAAALAEKYSTKPSAASSAAGSASTSQADLPSIPYSTFFLSLFELVDLWCADSSATNYAELLDQLFQKLTVKVETRSDEEEAAQAAKEAAGKDGAPDQFLLLQRALHVYSEALRVEEFAALCAEASGDSLAQSDVLESLGALMNASHVSCARAYDCSTDDLDVLVNLCVQKAGAVGARLTGAGWGGCVVALFDASVFVPDGVSADVARSAHAQSVDRILDIIISEYYRAHCGMDDRDPQRDNWKDLLFVSEPAAGAAIVLTHQKA